MKNLDSLKKIVPLKFQPLLLPVTMFLVLLFLSILVIKFSFGAIKTQRGRLSEDAKNGNILKQKQMLLQEISDQLSQSTVSSFTLIVPDKNPVLISVSQFKNLAAILGVAFSNFKTGSEILKGDSSSVQLTFEITGTFPQVLDFLSSVRTLAPLTSLDKVRISQNVVSTKAEISVSAYWFALPKKIPSINEPSYDLTQNERELLGKLSTFSLPSFVTAVPSVGVARDPFK